MYYPQYFSINWQRWILKTGIKNIKKSKEIILNELHGKILTDPCSTLSYLRIICLYLKSLFFHQEYWWLVARLKICLYLTLSTNIFQQFRTNFLLLTITQLILKINICLKLYILYSYFLVYHQHPCPRIGCKTTKQNNS